MISWVTDEKNSTVFIADLEQPVPVALKQFMK
jgi:hypothetical protein